MRRTLGEAVGLIVAVLLLLGGPLALGRATAQVAGRPANRLQHEASPYLLQHAHNPVDWYPWGDEAFAKAKREGKPIFLSIGYATCHWCHVMEAESFEDPEVARYLNANYVAVKVDREERPAVDAVYMEAVQAMTGRGGWPMTLVLDHDRRPFFAATYLPARDGDREGLVGLLTVLRGLHEVWVKDAPRASLAATKVVEAIKAEAGARLAGALPGPDMVDAAVAALASSFDAEEGGFGGAPKFPRPSVLDLLLRIHARSGNPRALEMAERTLQAMASGGIQDQLGGGFHRYSIDAGWRVPHFEKMLYDNAQLASVYLAAYQVTGKAEYANVARRTLHYLDREMSDPSGGFHSATDADSQGPGGAKVEGWYFTWTPRDLVRALGGARAEVAAACFGVTEAGDLEGRSVLHRPASGSKGPGPPGPACEAVRRDLLAARAARPPPVKDDKVVAAWNGLAVSAFARGALVLDEPRLAARAVRALEHLVETMRPGGRLLRSWRHGRPGAAATLEDHAFAVQGALDLFESTGGARWLQIAIDLQRAQDQGFRDAAGGYFRTAHDDERLLTREKPAMDGAEPSGNAVAALNLLRLAEFTGDRAYRATAVATLEAFAGGLDGAATPVMLSAAAFATGETLEVVLVSPRGGGARALLDVVRRAPVGTRVLITAEEGTELAIKEALVPLLKGRRPIGGKATAFVCKGTICDLPTSDPAVLARLLGIRDRARASAAGP